MISGLITKYLNGKANEHEVLLVFNWIESSKENKKQFIALKKAWAISQVSDLDKKTIWEQLQKSINKTKTFKFTNIYRYAAILIIALSIGSVVWLSKDEQAIETNSVVLELEETNSKIDLLEDRPIIENQLTDVISKHTKNEIIYISETTNTPISYHTINVPFGKTFKVTLSDGSIVHLNAGSSLKYPKQFSTSSKSRKVFLEGEAFFNITKDNNRPFIVDANNINITVLGTEFNVNNRKNNVDCVLVEGSVELSDNKNNSIKLIPNEKTTYNIDYEFFTKIKVNTKLYTSWINGEYIFEDSSFEDISNKLTQFYNVKIENYNSLLKTQKFSGTVNIKKSSIESILDLLSIDTPFSYTREENIITIRNNQL